VRVTTTTMAQFDVFVNPLTSLRRAYPFVVAMQSDFTVNGTEQLVAPIVSNEYEPSGVRRIMPVVAVQGSEHIVLVPRLTVMRTRDLIQKVSSIAAARTELLAAIDYLFFGV
jgi:toxin CcdB